MDQFVIKLIMGTSISQPRGLSGAPQLLAYASTPLLSYEVSARRQSLTVVGSAQKKRAALRRLSPLLEFTS